MHCVLLADLAAVVSQHGPAMLQRPGLIPASAVTAYWAATRARLDLWHQTMARYRTAEQSGHMISMRSWWRDHLVVLEEVLVCEILTRVIAALGAELDAGEQNKEIAPVTHTVYMTHVEARNRVQQLMLFGRGNSVQDAVRLNRLRQGVERWIDACVGRMSVQSSHSLKYAIRPERAAEFAAEMRQYGTGISRQTASWLMNAAMHDMLSRRTSEAPAMPQANRDVARSVMRMFRPEAFDSVGVLKSLWLNRLQLGSDHTDLAVQHVDGYPGDGYPGDGDQNDPGSQTEHDQHFERWYM